MNGSGMGYNFRTAYALRSFGVAALGLLRPANCGGCPTVKCAAKDCNASKQKDSKRKTAQRSANSVAFADNRGKYQPKEREHEAKPEAEPGVVSVGIFEEVFAHGLDSIAKSSANGI